MPVVCNARVSCRGPCGAEGLNAQRRPVPKGWHIYYELWVSIGVAVLEDEFEVTNPVVHAANAEYCGFAINAAQ